MFSDPNSWGFDPNSWGFDPSSEEMHLTKINTTIIRHDMISDSNSKNPQSTTLHNPPQLRSKTLSVKKMFTPSTSLQTCQDQYNSATFNCLLHISQHLSKHKSAKFNCPLCLCQVTPPNKTTQHEHSPIISVHGSNFTNTITTHHHSTIFEKWLRIHREVAANTHADPRNYKCKTSTKLLVLN